MKPAFDDLADAFVRATGHALAIDYDSAGAIQRRVQKGDVCDAVVIQKPAIEALQRQGKIAPGSIVVLARSGIAVAVRKGAPKPAVDSPDALKRTLLAARSIAYPDPARGHASGIHFERVLEQLGIAPTVRAKAKLFDSTFVDFAAGDEAEIAVTQPMEILAAPGYELAGWLPPELQDEEGFTWAAGVDANAKEPEAATTLIRFLSSPAAAAAIEAKGMMPMTR
jgi:molybdate transport system substrate-binding protein